MPGVKVAELLQLCSDVAVRALETECYRRFASRPAEIVTNSSETRLVLVVIAKQQQALQSDLNTLAQQMKNHVVHRLRVGLPFQQNSGADKCLAANVHGQGDLTLADDRRSARATTDVRYLCHLTTQAQRPGAQEATIATVMRWPGSLERMVSHHCALLATAT